LLGRNENSVVLKIIGVNPFVVRETSKLMKSLVEGKAFRRFNTQYCKFVLRNRNIKN